MLQKIQTMRDDEFRQRVEAVFMEAAVCSAEKRSGFLDEQCGDDAVLRREVESLLNHHDESQSFLTTPAIVAEFSNGSPEDALGIRQQPKRIGSYTVLEEIGRGGMGVVYKAQQEQPNRNVAIKLIDRALATKDLVRRFQLESEVLGRLQHPGIAQIFEAGTAQVGDQSVPYFALEFVDGVPLNEYIEKHNLSIRDQLLLIERIAEAIQHAHTRGVIHRDLKPANILVDQSGQPKILDFGVARVLDSEAQMTAITQDTIKLIGTLAYMSPEQASGDRHAIDARSDVYALGVIAYEVLTGRPPVDLSGLRAGEALKTIIASDPPRAGSIKGVLRGDIETVIAKAMEHETDRRYQTARDLAEDIRRHLNHEPILARRASAMYQLHRFAKRHTALVGTGVAALIGLIALSIVLLYANQKVRQESARFERINSLLLEMLRAPDPSVDGREVLLVDLLDRFGETIGMNAADDPQVEAALRDALGSTYLSLGQWEPAEVHLTRALKLRRELHGPNALETLRTAAPVARLRKEQGRYNEAIELLVPARDRFLEELGPEHEDTMLATNNLAVVYKRLDVHDKAREMFTSLLETQLRVYGDRDEQTLGTMNNLAGVLSEMGEHAAAEDMYKKLVAACTDIYGNEHPRTMTAKNGLAVCFGEQGKYAQAAARHRQNVETLMRILGPTHPHTMMTRYSLGSNLLKQELFEESKDVLEAVVTDGSATLPPDHWHLAVYRGALGTCLAQLGDHERAEILLLESLQSLRTTFPDEHSRVQNAIARLVDLYQQTGRPAEADRYRKLITSTGSTHH